MSPYVRRRRAGGHCRVVVIAASSHSSSSSSSTLNDTPLGDAWARDNEYAVRSRYGRCCEGDGGAARPRPPATHRRVVLAAPLPRAASHIVPSLPQMSGNVAVVFWDDVSQAHGDKDVTEEQSVPVKVEELISSIVVDDGVPASTKNKLVHALRVMTDVRIDVGCLAVVAHGPMASELVAIVREDDSARKALHHHAREALPPGAGSAEDTESFSFAYATSPARESVRLDRRVVASILRIDKDVGRGGNDAASVSHRALRAYGKAIDFYQRHYIIHTSSSLPTRLDAAHLRTQFTALDDDYDGVDACIDALTHILTHDLGFTGSENGLRAPAGLSFFVLVSVGSHVHNELVDVARDVRYSQLDRVLSLLLSRLTRTYAGNRKRVSLGR